MRSRYLIAKTVEVYDDTTKNRILWGIGPRRTTPLRNGKVPVFFRLEKPRFVEASAHFFGPYADRLVTTHGP